MIIKVGAAYMAYKYQSLHFVNPCNFRTLDRFKHSWLATAAEIWNELLADLSLQEEASG